MEELSWNLEPSVILGIVLLSAAYGLGIGPVRRRLHMGLPVAWWRQVAFYVGMLCVLLALASPLDELADETLFSAHMVQHILLTFIAPPLWLLGIPGWIVQLVVPDRILKVLTNPLPAFLIFNGVMWLWHLPGAYDAALEQPLLHIFEHLTFMASACIGWWPILGPVNNLRMNPALRLAYLIPAMFSCTALAALITLSANLLYPFYDRGILPWNLTPLRDQQLGGLVMWWTGDLIYLVLIVSTINSLFSPSPSENSKVSL